MLRRTMDTLRALAVIFGSMGMVIGLGIGLMFNNSKVGAVIGIFVGLYVGFVFEVVHSIQREVRKSVAAPKEQSSSQTKVDQLIQVLRGESTSQSRVETQTSAEIRFERFALLIMVLIMMMIALLGMVLVIREVISTL
jgi:hypothetical protein